MMDVLNFVFSDFWHFIGTLLLLGAIAEIVQAFFQPRVYRCACQPKGTDDDE